MNNLVYVIGRLTRNVEVEKTEDGKNYSTINIAVPRSYKNEEGIYETDFVDIKLYNGIAKSTADYCKTGDLVGIKGRIETISEEINGKEINKTLIVAEKISFLATQKNHEKKDEIEMD